MKKKVRIEVVGTLPAQGRRKDSVWEKPGQAVYRQCRDRKSVIAFSEGRRYAEKLSYYVNQIAGEGFSRVHHGSLSKEQRLSVEQVLQIGCPCTVSGTMQRLSRAGHNPGRTSVIICIPAPLRKASTAV